MSNEIKSAHTLIITDWENAEADVEVFRTFDDALKRFDKLHGALVFDDFSYIRDLNTNTLEFETHDGYRVVYKEAEFKEEK